jgi:hypothetical protein
MSPVPVVPKIVTLREPEFHARLAAGWARSIALVGRGTFADRIEMTPKGLGKVLAGSTPHACTLFNSRAAHPSALDELLGGYGLRWVPSCAIASTDVGTGIAMLRAATACVEAEADGIDHVELLAMEPELRASAEKHARLLARIDALRGIK